MYISEPTFFPLDFWPAAIIHLYCGGREVANPTANGVLDTLHHKHIDLKIFLQTETIYQTNTCLPNSTNWGQQLEDSYISLQCGSSIPHGTIYVPSYPNPHTYNSVCTHVQHKRRRLVPDLAHGP